jgi:lipid II:glycine glycyltransferase (peptidoglycan interpeptide bridge formation enzyme)
MQPAIVSDRDTWNEALLSLPRPHVLQSWEWGNFKSRYGWSATHWLIQDTDGAPRAATLVLQRQLSRLPYGVLYVPKGPILDHGDMEAWDAVLMHLKRLAHRQRAIFVKIDPDVCADNTAVIDRLSGHGWQPSQDQIQFRNTMTIDLTLDQDRLLAGMKSKWRYNVRLSKRRGTSIHPGTLRDLPLLYKLYQETARRDGFIIRPFEYYRDAWGSFIERGLAHPLIARFGQDAIGMVLLFRFGDRAWYMYGASRNQHREKMPNHLLQWQAIRWAKSVGCTVYDLWGAPDKLVESDPMWGVYRFKQGFGADLVRHIGAYDYVNSRLLYWVYTVGMPRLLSFMRRRYWQNAD